MIITSHNSWFRERIRSGELLVAPGAFDSFTATIVESKGAEAVYCGGFAATASAFALPDVGLMGATDMLQIYRRMSEAITSPLIVDADAGYGGPLNVYRMVAEMGRIGVSAVHIEDQLEPKRCGHIGGKRLVSIDDAERRIAAAVEASDAGGPAIIARTDALAVEGMDAVLARGQRFAAAGAHAFFVDAVTSTDQIEQIIAAVALPLVFNAASTGVSPVLSHAELTDLGVAGVIYPIETLMAAYIAAGEMTDRILAGNRIEPPTTFATLTSALHLDEYVERDRRMGA